MSTERLVNMFPERAGRQPVTLRSVPGLSNTVQLGEGPVRALLSSPEGVYAVLNGALVLWDGATVTTLGRVTDGETTMTRSTEQVAVAAGGNYYIWTGADLVAVTSPAFSNVGSVVFLDSRFVLSQGDGQRFAVSAINDGTALDALDFASAEQRPDNLVRSIANGGLLWNYGKETVEPWDAVSDLDFPFQRVQSTLLEKGLRSKLEAALLDNTIFWIGSDHRPYRQEQFTPVNVGPSSVAASLEAHQTAVTFAYQYEGHDFFCIRFPDREAWCYDTATQSWHERATGPEFSPWKAVATVEHSGKWYAGTTDGYLCEFTGFEDQGAPLRREAVSQNISKGGNRFTVPHVAIRVEKGREVMSQFSGDSGQNWSRERRRTATSGLVHYYGNGQFRECAMRLACSENADFAVYEAGVEIR